MTFSRVDEELESLLGVDDVVDLDERAVLHVAVVDLEDLVADVEDALEEFLSALVHEPRHELSYKNARHRSRRLFHGLCKILGFITTAKFH